MSYSTSFDKNDSFVGVIVATGSTKEETITKLKKMIEKLESVDGNISIASNDVTGTFDNLGKAGSDGRRVDMLQVVSEITIPRLTRDFDYNNQFK